MSALESISVEDMTPSKLEHRRKETKRFVGNSRNTKNQLPKSRMQRKGDESTTEKNQNMKLS